MVVNDQACANVMFQIYITINTLESTLELKLTQNFLSCSKYIEDSRQSGLHQQYGL